MCTVSKQERHQHTGPKKKQEQQNRPCAGAAFLGAYAQKHFEASGMLMGRK